MQLTTQPRASGALSWLKRWRQQVDRSRLIILLRAGVLLCLAASLQAAYLQCTLPTLADMQVNSGTAELVLSQDLHVYTLALRLDHQLNSLKGVCSGYRRGEANLQDGQPVKAWVARGEVYQLQSLSGETYRPNNSGEPCSMFSTLDTAMARPKMALGVAALGALLAVLSLCALTGGRMRSRNSPI